MLVPRAYGAYGSMNVNVKEKLDEKKPSSPARNLHVSPKMPQREKRTEKSKPQPQEHTTNESPHGPSTPIPVSADKRAHPLSQVRNIPIDGQKPAIARRKKSTYNPYSLPPEAIAILEATRIPQRRPGRFRQQALQNSRRISIDELVNDWKNDDSLSASYASSPALSMLLEDTDAAEEATQKDYFPPPSQESICTEAESYLHTRSTSAESMPSLDADEASLLSTTNPSTPESLRSQRSTSNLRKEKTRSTPTAEECAQDHPLILTHPADEDPDDSLILAPADTKRSTRPKPKSRFTSHLTTSLQALKNGFNYLTTSSPPTATATRIQQLRQERKLPASPFPDDVLWSHPFLFPRFSSEVRPALNPNETPSEAQRRYLNPPPPPAPLTFEEQEAPFQLALHAPYLQASNTESSSGPQIPLQTYTRTRQRSAHSRRRGSSSSAGWDPSSEAGRALLGAAGVRQREVRENPDFMRIVVLEMEMRRKGKLEGGGRARIWLPPRKLEMPGVEARGENRKGGLGGERVPRRWVGLSADC